MRKQAKKPRCLVIAGPNGAGKTTQIALKRIAERVKQGGHDVASKDLLRRFARGWDNFCAVYRALADTWAVYDNSGEVPRLLERSK